MSGSCGKGKWEAAGRNRGKGNYDQHILYEESVFKKLDKNTTKKDSANVETEYFLL